ncbi:MAG: NUDIX hydrolase [Alphaproteobacteria bacterium]|nr:NUDIX hydrolase [Alphaproteobacteria bacterium]
MSATTIPAATILIVRDSPHGLEVFMVKRHHQIDFVAGALVFPGGKVTVGDGQEALRQYADGVEDIDTEMHGVLAAAIREAFEESGILFARPAGETELVSGTRLIELASYRRRLETQEITLLEMLQREQLRLAYDRLVHFAHWITPENMPKRFDTHFFVAEAPAGQIGTHDGRESVDSLWITPHDAITDRKRWNVIFPTKLNLMKLARSGSVATALDAARASQPLTVTPWVEQTPDGSVLRIRDDAGYEQTQALLKDSL